MKISRKPEAVDALDYVNGVVARLVAATDNQRRVFADFRENMAHLRVAVEGLRASLVSYDRELATLQGDVKRLGDTQWELVGIMDRSLQASRFKAAA